MFVHLIALLAMLYAFNAPVKPVATDARSWHPPIVIHRHAVLVGPPKYAVPPAPPPIPRLYR